MYRAFPHLGSRPCWPFRCALHLPPGLARAARLPALIRRMTANLHVETGPICSSGGPAAGDLLYATTEGRFLCYAFLSRAAPH